MTTQPPAAAWEGRCSPCSHSASWRSSRPWWWPRVANGGSGAEVASRAGVLTPQEESWRRVSNGWYESACTDPSGKDPLVDDRDLDPGAVAWFTSSATHLISPVRGYLALPDGYGVPWERVESERPGQVVYEDDVQVVAIASD
jgi:hypothetical protein